MSGSEYSENPSVSPASVYEGGNFRFQLSFEDGKQFPVNMEGLARTAGTVLENPAVNPGGKFWDFSVVFCGNEFIRGLNKKFRNIDEPTDILSFELGGDYEDECGKVVFSAGEVIISFEKLLSNSSEFGVTVNEELKRLIIHGILHLSGMDHSDNSPEQEMLKIQENILNTLVDEIVFEEE